MNTEQKHTLHTCILKTFKMINSPEGSHDFRLHHTLDGVMSSGRSFFSTYVRFLVTESLYYEPDHTNCDYMSNFYSDRRFKLCSHGQQKM